MSKPFLKWAGGKRWLVESHVEIFPSSYNRYIEPFLGSGAVYFAIKPNIAILSDANKDLIETYICVRDHWKDVYETLKIHHNNHSSDYYYTIRDSVYHDKIERAARFIYLNRTCWNGLYRVNKFGKFNVPKGTKNSVVFPSDDFFKISIQLADAEIASNDFEVTIGEARRGDLIFIDPPYTVKHDNNGFIKYNEKIFTWNDQVRLRSAVEEAVRRGASFILTNANHSSVVELYEGFRMDILTRNSVISGDPTKRKKCDELLIRG